MMTSKNNEDVPFPDFNGPEWVGRKRASYKYPPKLTKYLRTQDHSDGEPLPSFSRNEYVLPKTSLKYHLKLKKYKSARVVPDEKPLPSLSRKKNSTPRKLFFSTIDSDKEVATNSKKKKKTASTIFSKEKYHLRQEKKTYERFTKESNFHYSSTPLSSPRSSRVAPTSESQAFADESNSPRPSRNILSSDSGSENSTLSPTSSMDSLCDTEICLNDDVIKSTKVIKQTMRQTEIKIQLLLAGAIKSTNESLRCKCNKILHKKQQENLNMLTEIHNKSLQAIEQMKTVIGDHMSQLDDEIMRSIEHFRARMEDTRVDSKRMRKAYERMLKTALLKISTQREEILSLRRRNSRFNQE